MRLFYLHPQLTSINTVREVVKRVKHLIMNKTVLDPFCGTGTIPCCIYRYAEQVICTDIEDWSKYLRCDLDKYNVVTEWNIHVLESIKKYKHDVLFTDPPNPSRSFQRSIFPSQKMKAYKYFGIKSLYKHWKNKNLDPRNLAGKGNITLSVVNYMIKYELYYGRTIIIYEFDKYDFTRYKPIKIANGKYGRWVIIK